MHIHSCLSPCADPGMSPGRIVQKSLEKGLDIIAICDHNSAENAGAAQRLGKRKGLNVFSGMEICSKEEVHILAIFKELKQTLAMQEYVYAHLPGTNRSDVLGEQVVADENNTVLGENFHMLIGATQLGLNEIVERIHLLKGVSIAAHIDRPAYGIIGRLGLIPTDLDLDGVEVSHRIPLWEARERLSEIGDIPCVTFSDAHVPDDIGKAWTAFVMAAPTLEEIRLALQGKEGRRIEV